MTAFRVGDLVAGDVQGLQAGVVYTVEEVIEQHLPFGTFVTYVVADDNGGRFPIANGHLVLTRVAG